MLPVLFVSLPRLERTMARTLILSTEGPVHEFHGRYGTTMLLNESIGETSWLSFNIHRAVSCLIFLQDELSCVRHERSVFLLPGNPDGVFQLRMDNI